MESQGKAKMVHKNEVKEKRNLQNNFINAAQQMYLHFSSGACICAVAVAAMKLN
jgi:hypothetical protein